MTRAGRHWVGTSGFSYAGWRGAFYPASLPARDWLAHYAEIFRSVELNTTFYRLPAASTVHDWSSRTPAGFLFAVKAWRGITHFRKLKESEDLLARFFGAIEGLGEKAGPVLFQLPPRFDLNLDRLERFLESLPRGRRYAFEFRDPRWHEARVYRALGNAGAAFCPFDLGGERAPRVVTADFVYVRLHGPAPGYRGSYSGAALASWARWLGARLDEGRDVHVYFDNTDEAAHAARDARRLERMLETRGSP